MEAMLEGISTYEAIYALIVVREPRKPYGGIYGSKPGDRTIGHNYRMGMRS